MARTRAQNRQNASKKEKTTRRNNGKVSDITKATLLGANKKENATTKSRKTRRKGNIKTFQSAVRSLEKEESESENLWQDRGDLWLGIDLGTTSIKAVLLNKEETVVLSVTRAHHANVPSDLGPTGNEQDVYQIFTTLEQMLLHLIKAYRKNIKGIGITGQMHGLILWAKGNTLLPAQTSDRNKNLVSHVHTWQDRRADYESFYPSDSSKASYVPPGYGNLTLLWLQTHRKPFVQRFDYCGTLMDYFVACLCDLDEPVTSDQLAASLGFYNENSKSWNLKVLQNTSFPTRMLPKIVSSETVVGVVKSTAFGWPVGCPVYVAVGDTQCAVYASLQSNSDAVVNIGTSIQLCYIEGKHESQRQVESYNLFPYFHNRRLSVFAGLNGGNAIQLFVHSINSWLTDLGCNVFDSTEYILKKLADLARKSIEKQGNKNISSEFSSTSQTNDSTNQINDSTLVQFIPAFYGERHDMTMKAALSNLTPLNFPDIGGVFRALCEGVIDTLHDNMPPSRLLKSSIQRICISGSVVNKNEFIRSRLEKLYGNTFELIYRDQNEACVGVAKYIMSLSS